MISQIEQSTLDIDWFFINQDRIGFVTSGAGRLPNSVADLDENLKVISSFFRNLPEISTIQINNELETIKKVVITESYLKDFNYMAKRGLYAFDKTYLNDFSNDEYHLVSKPLKPLRIENLPIEIINLINETSYSGNVENEVSINSKNIT